MSKIWICSQCKCRAGYDAFNQYRKPCEHWIRWTCPRAENGSPCSKCDEIVEECEYYKPNSEHIEECLGAVNQVWDDGYRFCPLIDCMGCEACYKEFEEGLE